MYCITVEAARSVVAVWLWQKALMNNKSHRNVSGDSERYCFDGFRNLFGVFEIVKTLEQLCFLSAYEVPVHHTNIYS